MGTPPVQRMSMQGHAEEAPLHDWEVLSAEEVPPSPRQTGVISLPVTPGPPPSEEESLELYAAPGGDPTPEGELLLPPPLPALEKFGSEGAQTEEEEHMTDEGAKDEQDSTGTDESAKSEDIAKEQEVLRPTGTQSAADAFRLLRASEHARLTDIERRSMERERELSSMRMRLSSAELQTADMSRLRRIAIVACSFCLFFGLKSIMPSGKTVRSKSMANPIVYHLYSFEPAYLPKFVQSTAGMQGMEVGASDM